MEENKEMIQMKDLKDTLDEHGKILKEHGEKIDKILGIVLTQQGQMKIMQGKIENIETMQKESNERIDKIELDNKEFKQIVNERFDKQEEYHKEFEVALGKLLKGEFQKRDKVISKHTKAIKEIKNKHTLGSFIMSKLKGLVSKTN